MPVTDRYYAPSAAGSSWRVSTEEHLWEAFDDARRHQSDTIIEPRQQRNYALPRCVDESIAASREPRSASRLRKA